MASHRPGSGRRNSDKFLSVEAGPPNRKGVVFERRSRGTVMRGTPRRINPIDRRSYFK